MPPAFEPPSETRKTYRVDWYRSPIPSATLRDLSRRSDAQGAFQALGHLGLFALTGTATYLLFDHGLWAAGLVALFCHGTVASFMSGVAMHELSHGTVFRTKPLNRIFAVVFGIIGMRNYHEYSMHHTHHHRYTLHPRADREVVLPKVPSLSPLYLLQLFTFNVTGGYESQGLIPTLRALFATAAGRYEPSERGEWLAALYDGYRDDRRKPVLLSRLSIAFHLAVLLVAAVFQLWLLVLVVSLPTFFAGWLRYFVGVPMHCGLQSEVSDFRKCVRTITLDPLSEFLYWHMNWHLEHHMYAGVPCYNLKALHRAVADDMPEPRTLVGAWREMREIWRRQQIDPDYVYDTPLPRPHDRAGESDAALAASIGDLAPKPLA